MISFKILEEKYNTSPKIFSQKIIFDLLRNKRGHLVTTYHETILYDNSLKEFMKRKYRIKECLDKIPKYYNYYKNYLRYFCHPTFVDHFINKKMVKPELKKSKVKRARKFIKDKATVNFLLEHLKPSKIDFSKIKMPSFLESFEEGEKESKQEKENRNESNPNRNEMPIFGMSFLKFL